MTSRVSTSTIRHYASSTILVVLYAIVVSHCIACVFTNTLADVVVIIVDTALLILFTIVCMLTRAASNVPRVIRHLLVKMLNFGNFFIRRAALASRTPILYIVDNARRLAKMAASLVRCRVTKAFHDAVTYIYRVICTRVALLKVTVRKSFTALIQLIARVAQLVVIWTLSVVLYVVFIGGIGAYFWSIRISGDATCGLAVMIFRGGWWVGDGLVRGLTQIRKCCTRSTKITVVSSQRTAYGQSIAIAASATVVRSSAPSCGSITVYDIFSAFQYSYYPIRPLIRTTHINVLPRSNRVQHHYFEILQVEVEVEVEVYGDIKLCADCYNVVAAQSVVNAKAHSPTTPLLFLPSTATSVLDAIVEESTARISVVEDDEDSMLDPDATLCDIHPLDEKEVAHSKLSTDVSTKVDWAEEVEATLSTSTSTASTSRVYTSSRAFMRAIREAMKEGSQQVVYDAAARRSTLTSDVSPSAAEARASIAGGSAEMERKRKKTRRGGKKPTRSERREKKRASEAASRARGAVTEER